MWSKIDRVLANGQWYIEMGYIHATYLIEGLSDHTSLKITFLGSPKRSNTFKFYEMWCNDPLFTEIIHLNSQYQVQGTKMQQVYEILKRLKAPL